MRKKEHLPVYGVGPLYGCAVAALTLAAVLMRDLPLLASGRLEGLGLLPVILGSILIMAGIALWIYAVPILHRSDPDSRQCMVLCPSVCILAFHDRADERNGGEVAESPLR